MSASETRTVRKPRSSGCRVCVQRRIKCDQTRPFCLRCRKANRLCPGFEPNVRFLDETPRLVQEFEEQQANLETSTTLPWRKQSVKSSGGRSGSDGSSSSDDPARDTFERKALVAIISPNIMTVGLLCKFLQSVSEGFPAKVGPVFPCMKYWLQEVAGCTGKSPALDHSIRAVAMSHLGRLPAYTNRDLVQNSRVQYGKALLYLKRALQGNDGLASETLSATVLLSFYEGLNSTEVGSWVRHAGGAGHLIRLRGPESHQTGLARATFLAFRNFLILESLRHRKPCFLDSPPWRALSENMQTDPALSLIETFYQEFVTIPRFIHDIWTNTNRTEEGYRALIARAVAHRQNLKAVEEKFHVALKEANLEVLEFRSLSPDNVFPMAFAYPDIGIASTHTGLLAVNVLINRAVHRLEDLLRSTRGDADEETESSSSQSDNLDAAFAICKSVEFFCAVPSFLSEFFLIFTLRVALMVFTAAGSEPERLWVLSQLRRISSRLELAGHNPNLEVLQF